MKARKREEKLEKRRQNESTRQKPMAGIGLWTGLAKIKHKIMSPTHRLEDWKIN
jgi:hypothetical protein